MWNSKKSAAAVFSAMALTLASVGNTIPAFAEEAAPTTSAVTAADNPAADMELGEEEMQKLVDEIQRNKTEMENSGDATDSTVHDYYADEHYDTDGNATLIKQEKIIYDSEEMQFIAVTTKDGDVFYILINYSAEGDEDNVFFLNKAMISTSILCSMLVMREKKKKTLRNRQRNMPMQPMAAVLQLRFLTVRKKLPVKQAQKKILLPNSRHL